MPGEKHNEIYRRLYEEAFGEGNLAVIDELLAPYYVCYSGKVQGREAVKQLISIFRFAFPDLQVVVKDQVGRGNKVVNRWVASGTHQGEFFGVPPTGKRLMVAGISIGRFERGRIVEEWCQWNTLGLLLQLGVIPALHLNGPLNSATDRPTASNAPRAA